MTRTLVALTLSLTLLQACATGPAPESQRAESGSAAARNEDSATGAAPGWAEPIPLDEDVLTGRLDNGLTYFVRRNAKPEQRAELRLVVNAGSVLEDEGQRGLAHFVEHMAFNGTENFEKQQLIEYLERIGMRFGPDINAYTSFDETVYMLEIPTDDAQIVDTAFQILSDWAGRVSFEGEEIDKERGVVVEEWRLGRGASGRIRDKQFPVLFDGSRYAERLPIGKRQILENASHETVRRFYREWYRPDLMAIVAVGDFDASAIEKRIKKQFAWLTNPEPARPRMDFPVPDHEETRFAIATDPEATGISLSVIYKRPPLEFDTRGQLRDRLMEQLYNVMLNSRLAELRQQADPPFQYGGAGSSALTRTKSAYRLSAVVRDGGVERGLRTLLTEARRVEEHGFNETEFDRAKVELQRQVERQYEERDKQESRVFASQYVQYFLGESPAPSIAYVRDLVTEILPTFSLEEINALADSRITEENRVILVSGPEKEEAGIPDEQQLLAVFDGVRRLDVTPWVDTVRDEPLVPRPPKPGRIVGEERIVELGVTRWELSNGVRVLLKPTDFKNDEVLLYGESDGGHSLYADEDYITARDASSIVLQMGAGKFSRIELEKALAGKVAGMSSYVGELTEGVRGSASPRDLETMFELLYLRFTGARKDEQAFQAYLARTRGWLENQEASPSYWFGKKFSETYNLDHPRRQTMTPSDLERMDLDRALEIYEDRFADASDFTFTLVGNFELEKIRPLVERWLGGLPSTDRDERWRDIGVEHPGEVVEFDLRRGLEPKSSVRITFHGESEWSPLQSHLLSSMADVLRIRLREVLREDMGGVYGVGVSGSLGRWPRERYSVTVSFGCGPERVDELVAAVMTEIRRMKQEGPNPDHIARVREMQARDREVNLERNRFWASSLLYHARNELDPLDILEYDEKIEAVTGDTMRGAAQHYLDEDRYVLGVLYPEENAASNATGEAGASAGSAAR